MSDSVRGPHVRIWVRDGVHARVPRPGVQAAMAPCRAMHFSPHCRLCDCRITAAGLAALLVGVRASPSQLELLQCVRVQLDCVPTFYSCDNMLTRSLAYNPLGDEGVAVLADWLATGPPLQVLM